MQLTEEQKREIWLAVYSVAVTHESTREEFFKVIEDQVSPKDPP